MQKVVFLLKKAKRVLKFHVDQWDYLTLNIYKIPPLPHAPSPSLHIYKTSKPMDYLKTLVPNNDIMYLNNFPYLDNIN